MNKQEVAQLKEDLTAEYKKNLEAIERVERLLAERKSTGGHPSEVNPEIPPFASLNFEPPHQPAKQDDVPTLIETVQALFNMFPDTAWTVSRIEEGLLKAGFKFEAVKPKSSINTSLARLYDRGVIRIVRRGRGKKPSVYKAANASTSPLEQSRSTESSEEPGLNGGTREKLAPEPPVSTPRPDQN